MKFWCCTATLLLSLAFSTSAAQAEKNWTRWRGPHENGHAMEKGLPTKWDKSSVTWKTPLKGQGQSSPVIWGERIFLTTALERGKQRVVMCINRNDGQVVWEKTAWTGEPEPTHRMNGWASATCATDGEHVYAFFGHGGGLFCYTMDGQLAWQKDLGEFESPWGVSACPVLYGDLVIQNCDADKDAYIIGLNKKTGKQVWKTKRDEVRGWSTPILVKAAGREELVVNGDTGPRAYNPKTGKEYWFCESFTGRGSPTLTPAAGLLVALNGKPGPLYAVKPGGDGNVTKTHRTWSTKRGGGRDLASPITIGNYVLVVNMKGVLTCYDAKSGKELWQERLAGNYSAAPIAYDGLAFFITEAGETVVVKAGPKAEVVGRYTVGGGDTEIFRSSHTPSDGQVFIRSDRVLYCIGKRNAAE